MSKTKSTVRGQPARPAITPLIGSLLRLPHEAIEARMLVALNTHGFDITGTELAVLLYPGPEGCRPIDLARRCNMTRQAMNYVLAGLERRGYVERRAGPDSPARAVHLTDRGWDMVVEIRRCVEEVEQEWAAHLGAARFAALRETLHDLSLWLGKLS